jgi:AmiR/NasT family two-component response regulator
MLDDGSGGTGASPDRTQVDGTAAAARERFRQLREQLAQAREQISHLEVALATNRRIGIAIGIVMTHHRVTDEQAFELLREKSQAHNQKLHDIAEGVIYTGRL